MKQEASRQIQEGEKRQFATLLLPSQVVGNPVLSAQVISLLGGHWGNIALQTEVAISASALLIFAGNTAIIGSYHVFLALSRMEFFPEFVQQRNKLRGTPHFSILLAIAIPICVLVAVQGAITVLGGSVTLLGMGIAYFTYARKKQQGHVPVPITHVGRTSTRVYAGCVDARYYAQRSGHTLGHSERAGKASDVFVPWPRYNLPGNASV
jgi:amino acid transporter